MAEITWIKLKTDMFDSTKIRLIEKLPEGDTILVIWIKLLTAAGKANANGYIMLTENIPMHVEEMAVVFDRPLNTVRLALEAFKRYGMIEIDDNEIICIANWEKHQNIDGMEKVRLQNAERNKKYRERKKQTALSTPKQNDDVSVTSHDGTDIDIDIDIDKERDKDKDSQSVSQIDFDFKMIQEHYEQNVRVATYKDCQLINEALEFYEPKLIHEAVKAGASQARSFTYILGILDNWRKEYKIKTYEDWQVKIHARDQRGTSSKQPNTFKDTFGHDVGF